ncbi:MAG: methyltransferase domain-containing protein [bacterium]|nr:methyltransferase domain-containing protein [bacterium]
MNSILARVLNEIALHYSFYSDFLKKKDKILDIGTGSGYTAQYIKSQKKDIEIHGLDIFNLLKVDIPIFIYDGKKFPFSDILYDDSLLFYVIHHVRDYKKLLEETIRVTKRNIIVIEEFNMPEAEYKIELEKEKRTLKAIGLPTSFYQHNFKKEELEDLFLSFSLKLRLIQKLDSQTDKKIEKYLYVLTK